MKQTDLEKLLADMSPKEKVDQMLQLLEHLLGMKTVSDCYRQMTWESKKAIGRWPVPFSGSRCRYDEKLQDDYMAKQPHHISMLFMMDVIHGMKTIFPAPLAQGATFDPGSPVSARLQPQKEASAAGLHVTFLRWLTLLRDARWAALWNLQARSCLNSRFSEAIKGFQGDDLKTPGKSCLLHQTLCRLRRSSRRKRLQHRRALRAYFREFYLPAYKAGIDAGAAMVMTSFNTINGGSGEHQQMADARYPARRDGI